MSLINLCAKIMAKIFLFIIEEILCDRIYPKHINLFMIILLIIILESFEYK